MGEITKGPIRFVYQSILTLLLFSLMIFYSGRVQSQVSISSVNVINAPASYCTNTNILINGTHWAAGYVLLGSSVTVTGFNINVVVNYNQPGIGISVITPFNETVNLGMLPAGSYTVTTIGQFNGSQTSSFPSSLVVGSLGCCPTIASFTSSANNNSACIGDSIIFTNTSVGPFTSQSWYENGVFITNTQNYATQVATAAANTYKLVINGATCNDSIEQIIQVFTYPTINLGPDAVICDGDNLLLDAGAGNNGYSWSTGAVGSTILADTGGLYYVDVTQSGCTSSDSINISLLPSPQVNLGIDTTICIGESLLLDPGLVGTSYLWQDNSIDPTFDVFGAGLYWVIVNGANGCSGKDSIRVDTMGCITTGINDLYVNNSLQTFPNPAKNAINIAVPAKIIGKRAKVKIFRLDGSLIYNQQILSLDNTVKVTIPYVSKGLYLLQLGTNNEQWKSKISILE